MHPILPYVKGAAPELTAVNVQRNVDTAPGSAGCGYCLNRPYRCGDPDGRSISNFESHGPPVVPIVVRNDGYHWGNPGVVRTTVLAKPLLESVCDAERPPRNEKLACYADRTDHGPHRARHLVVVSLGTCADLGELQLPVQLRPRADYLSPMGVGQLVRSRRRRPDQPWFPRPGASNVSTARRTELHLARGGMECFVACY